MAVHDTGKVVPPQDVMVEFAEKDRREKLSDQISARILKEADLDGQVENALQELAQVDPQGTDDLVREHLKTERADLWKMPIELQSDQLLKGGDHG